MFLFLKVSLHILFDIRRLFLMSKDTTWAKNDELVSFLESRVFWRWKMKWASSVKWKPTLTLRRISCYFHERHHAAKARKKWYLRAQWFLIKCQFWRIEDRGTSLSSLVSAVSIKRTDKASCVAVV